MILWGKWREGESDGRGEGEGLSSDRYLCARPWSFGVRMEGRWRCGGVGRGRRGGVTVMRVERE